jgi:hypothetical protein
MRRVKKIGPKISYLCNQVARKWECKAFTRKKEGDSGTIRIFKSR